MNDHQSYDIQGILREMRDEYWRGIEEAEATQIEERQDYILFRLGGERFGIASRFAREVLRLPRLVRVPRLPRHIAGIFNLRGQIVAVTDLRELLNLPAGEPAPRSQLLVVEAAGLTTALLTDSVEGLHAIPATAIEPVTEGLSGFPREIASGHVVGSDGLLLLLNLEELLARPEFVIDQKGEAG